MSICGLQEWHHENFFSKGMLLHFTWAVFPEALIWRKGVFDISLWQRRETRGVNSIVSLQFRSSYINVVMVVRRDNIVLSGVVTVAILLFLLLSLNEQWGSVFGVLCYCPLVSEFHIWVGESGHTSPVQTGLIFCDSTLNDWNKSSCWPSHTRHIPLPKKHGQSGQNRVWKWCSVSSALS